MYSYCPDCDHLFRSRAFALAPGVKGATFSEMTVNERCPNCTGLNAFMLLGTYDADIEGVISFLDGPELSKEILIRFKVLAEKAAKEGYTRERFFREAESISKAFSGLRKFAKKHQKTFLNVMLGAVTSSLAEKGVEKVYDAFIKPPDTKTEQPIIKQTTINNNTYYFNSPPPAPDRGSNYTPKKKKRRKR